MQFGNIYYGLRHGISEANVQNIIVSNPADGVAGYGLAPAGRADLYSTLPSLTLPDNLCVLTSDFLRAKQTAELLCTLHDLPPPCVDARLRERYFGDFEKQDICNYAQKVWADDSQQLTRHNVEGCMEVRARLCQLLDELEAQHKVRHFLFVSHGDTLQILQTIFASIPPHLHRSVPHFAPGEFRRLTAPSQL
eukprot:NODE_5271_length_676_cov_36.739526_g5108_i0.p1 GENE.NODE_5271_length_676_cov_36.739526_g5108_i0~~NODE_5271_length_676_cov_36.739526_g5108_i0.p1  ORF type:complete len:193 (+),score=25.77 NODE_5271_length_676_cov_36.739526_g5108_i0:63-641(+)